MCENRLSPFVRSFTGPHGQTHTRRLRGSTTREAHSHRVHRGGDAHRGGPRATRRSLGGSGASTSTRPGSKGGPGAKVSTAPSAAAQQAPLHPARRQSLPRGAVSSCAPHVPAPRRRDAAAPPRRPHRRRSRTPPRIRSTTRALGANLGSARRNGPSGPRRRPPAGSAARDRARISADRPRAPPPPPRRPRRAQGKARRCPRRSSCPHTHGAFRPRE